MEKPRRHICILVKFLPRENINAFHDFAIDDDDTRLSSGEEPEHIPAAETTEAGRLGTPSTCEGRIEKKTKVAMPKGNTLIQKELGSSEFFILICC